MKMKDDLNLQKSRAEELADMIIGNMEYDEDEDGETVAVLTTDMMLDALAGCGFVLMEGKDAGLAWWDGIHEEVATRGKK
ncbi:MAG: hypothetical protein ACO3CH_00155 [Ilumatobacteraceae bacterium]|jgi:hypothetical protein|nr:hypothetical protein [Chitinophagales bacterium]